MLETVVGIATIVGVLLAVVAGMVKLASVYPEEWEQSARYTTWIANKTYPFCVGIGVGILASLFWVEALMPVAYLALAGVLVHSLAWILRQVYGYSQRAKSKGD